MKSRIYLIVALLWSGVWGAWSQVSVDIQLEQQQYLRNETLPVLVRISNLSGQPIRIGEIKDWLTFNVQNREGKIVTPTQDIVPGGQFELDSASSVTKIIDLSLGYDFNAPGGYRVSAMAHFPQLKLDVSSRTLTFDIVRGATMWEEVCGVPLTNRPPDSVRFSLVQAYNLKQLKLYVRTAEDPEGPFVRVIPLGSIVSFAQPERAIDRYSVLHVLYQSGPRDFEYCQVSCRGSLILRASYSVGAKKPHLTVNEDGAVRIVGGVFKSSVPPLVPGAAPLPQSSPPSENASKPK